MISSNRPQSTPPTSEIRLHEAHGLQQLVDAAWRSLPQLLKGNLAYDVHENAVVLRGQVRTYYQKQLVQESLRKVQGVNAIRNEIEVL